MKRLLNWQRWLCFGTLVVATVATGAAVGSYPLALGLLVAPALIGVVLIPRANARGVFWGGYLATLAVGAYLVGLEVADTPTSSVNRVSN